jgi:hypothetical protein
MTYIFSELVYRSRTARMRRDIMLLKSLGIFPTQADIANPFAYVV